MKTSYSFGVTMLHDQEYDHVYKDKIKLHIYGKTI